MIGTPGLWPVGVGSLTISAALLGFLSVRFWPAYAASALEGWPVEQDTWTWGIADVFRVLRKAWQLTGRPGTLRRTGFMSLAALSVLTISATALSFGYAPRNVSAVWWLSHFGFALLVAPMAHMIVVDRTFHLLRGGVPPRPKIEEAVPSSKTVAPFLAGERTPCAGCAAAVETLRSNYVGWEDSKVFPASWVTLDQCSDFPTDKRWSGIESLRACKGCWAVWLLKFDTRDGYYSGVHQVPPPMLLQLSGEVTPAAIADYLFTKEYGRWGGLILDWSHSNYLRFGEYDGARAARTFLEALKAQPMEFRVARGLLLRLDQVLERASQKQYTTTLSEDVAESMERFDNMSYPVSAETLVALTKQVVAYADEKYAAVPIREELPLHSLEPLPDLIEGKALYAGMDVAERARSEVQMCDLFEQVLGRPALIQPTSYREALVSRFGKKHRIGRAFAVLGNLPSDLEGVEAGSVCRSVMEISPDANGFDRPFLTRSQFEKLKDVLKSVRARLKRARDDRKWVDARDGLASLVSQINNHKRYWRQWE